MEASRSLATILWMCTEQNVTVEVLERRATQKASNDEQYHTPSTFACGVFLEGENHRVGLKGVLVEQDGDVRVACVRNKLVGVRNVVTGFL